MRTCGGKTRKGGKCGRPKGWGTDHPGSGRCKFHGGSTRNGRKAAGKEAALAFARGALGSAVSGSPLDAMQESVDLARGLVDYYRHELAAAATARPMNTDRIELLRPQYAEAIRLETACAKAAIDTGIAERRQLLAERQAELLAAAIADGLAEAFGELATPERRTVFARVVGARLLVLEGTEDPLVVEGHARALPAAA